MTKPCSAAVSAAVRRASRPPHARARRPRDSRRDAGATSFGAFLIISSLLAFTSAAAGANYERGAVIRVAQVYLSPDASSAKLAEMDRGREIIVLETSREWAHVQANLTEERTITGWVLDKGVIRTSTPNGDKILFGEAVDSEDQASRRHGRNGAAQDAMRLYYRVADYFPTSPLAGEAMYRSADIRWQLEKADVASRPSSRERESFLREGMEEKYMKEVIKKFPGTKWADLAAFHLIDNKLCGDWQGLPKCPEMESGLYEKYAERYPDSPKAAEALYEATYRQGVLVEMYLVQEEKSRSQRAADAVQALATQMKQRYAQSDFTARAASIAYRVQQQIPVYGNDRD